MNQVLNSALNQSTKITVTSIPGNPVLSFDGTPSNKIIAKEVARQFGFQMQFGVPVAHSFCGVIDPAPVEMIAKEVARQFGIPVAHSFCGVLDPALVDEVRPEAVDLWCKEGHEGSRRWACAG